MRTYRQYCPIARAAEVVAERWTPLVVRNMLWGATTFTEIARGVPTMSRSMLIRRLGELERWGVVAVAPKPSGQGSLYTLTPAGRDLADVIESLSVWGERWLETTSQHSDPGFALWSWAQFQVDRAALAELAARRVVVRFTFPEETPSNRRYWLVVDRGEIEVCYGDPGGDLDADVVARSEPFTRWHAGELAWGEALATGDVRVTAPPSLAAAIPRWNTHDPVFPAA